MRTPDPQKTGTSAALAAFAAALTFDDIPDDVIGKLKLHILDGIACCLVGSTLPWTRKIADLVASEGGVPAATVIGMVPYGMKIEIHAADFLQEKKLLGCAMGSNRFRVDMPRYVDFYMSGRLKLDDMLSGHIKLEQVNEALDALKTGEVARNVIVFDT